MSSTTPETGLPNLADIAAGELARKQDVVTHLYPPTTAPKHLLEAVLVDPDGSSLYMEHEQLGRVAIRLIFDDYEGQESPAEAAGFRSPLLADLDPDAAKNPPLMSVYPYTEIPYGAHVGVVIEASTDTAGVEFSEPEAYEDDNAFGMHLQSLFPGENIDGTSRYKVRALKQTRRVIGMLLRFNGYEPTFRRQTIYTPQDLSDRPGHFPKTPPQLPKVVNNEYLAGVGFRVDDESPDRAFAVVAYRYTERDGTTEAEKQALLFKQHNASEGPAGNAGLVEAILLTGTQTKWSNVDLERIVVPEPTIPAIPDYVGDIPGFGSRGAMKGGGSLSFGGPLASGSVGYGRPRQVKVAEKISVDGNSMNTFAAFRFVMVGAGVEPVTD